MNRNGLTVTMVFLAESANYGEGIGNITSLKKMTRVDNKQYTYIWTGKSKTFELTNLTNKGGIEIHKIIVTCEPAE